MKIGIEESSFLWLPFLQLALRKLVSPFGPWTCHRSWAEILASRCSHTCVQRHISAAFPQCAESQAIICKCVVPDIIQQAKMSGMQPPWRWNSSGFGQWSTGQQDPIGLEQRLLHSEEEPVQGKVWGVREGDLVAAEGMSLGEPQELLAFKPMWSPPSAPWQWEEKLSVWEWAHAANLGFLKMTDTGCLQNGNYWSDFSCPVRREIGTSLLLFCFSFHSPCFFPPHFDFPFFPHVFIFLCCFSCCLNNEYRFPCFLCSTVPSTTFIYIFSWDQDAKNSLQSMEIPREGS